MRTGKICHTITLQNEAKIRSNVGRTERSNLNFFCFSRFAGRALFLSRDVIHDLKPINNLLILYFPSLTQIAVNARKHLFRNEFLVEKLCH